MGVKLCSLCSHSATCSVRFGYNKFTYYLCKEHFYWILIAMRNSIPGETAIVRWL